MAFKEEISRLNKLADYIEQNVITCRSCQGFHATANCRTLWAEHICYRCGQKGHPKSKCSNPKAEKCERCMLIGHNFNDCHYYYMNPCRKCGYVGHSRASCGNESRYLPALLPWTKSKQALQAERENDIKRGRDPDRDKKKAASIAKFKIHTKRNPEQLRKALAEAALSETESSSQYDMMQFWRDRGQEIGKGEWF